MTDKPISSLEAEDSILAYMLLNDDAYKVCSRKLCLADFYDDANRSIYRILADCCGKEPDQAARLTRCWHELRQSMRTKAASAKLGQLMCELSHWAKTAPALQYWIRKLVDCSQRRAVVLMAQEVTEAATSASGDFLDVLRANYKSIMDRAASTESASLVGDTVFQMVEQLEEAKSNPSRMLTGIEALDHHCGGVARGENVVIGGMTGTGKSAISLAMAVHAASHGRSVAFFSLEMTAAQLQQRILAQLACVNLRNIVTSSYTKDERRAMVEASVEMQTWKLAIYDRANVRVRDIYAQAMSHKADHGLDLVVLDYCQLVKPDNPKASIYEGLTQVSRDIKIMAKELCVPVLNLAQLNRESIKAGDPRCEHLKGSGSLAEDADTVMLLSERQLEDGEKLENGQKAVRLRLDKARQGERAVFRLLFDAPYQRFVRPPVVEWEF